MGDFTGFTFNGVHSSAYNIVRVSDGSRYNDTLVPTFKDTTIQVPGSDDTLYWESFYSSRTWNIQIAFDNLSEDNLRSLRQAFSAKVTGDLIFDETPYKKYSVKVQSSPTIKTICFMENGSRVYKGEGTIQFISYTPYARSVYKWLGSYSSGSYPNRSEWSSSCGMWESNVSEGITYDSPGTDTTNSQGYIHLVNNGDAPTNWITYIPVLSVSSSDWKIDLCDSSSVKYGTLSFSSVNDSALTSSYLKINTRTNLVEACTIDSAGTVTMQSGIYNKYLTSGNFAKIKLGKSDLYCYTIDASSNKAPVVPNKIEYDYLYY